MKNCSRFLFVATLILTFVFVATADAPKLTFKFTTIEVKGAQDTRVFGTNNAAVMVGAYVDSSGVSHGFMLKGGKVTKLDDPAGTNTNCAGVNKADDVAGYYLNSSGAEQAFWYHAGKFSDIGPAGATSSEAFGINDHGNIAGYFVDSSRRQPRIHLER